MSSTFSSRTYNFNTILGRSSFPDYTAKRVSVPAFQRGYSWDSNHVATFWDDIWDFQENSSKTDTYFLGPVVVLPADDEITILDGQQRLATATILLSSLRDYARKNCGNKGNDLARDVQRDHIWVDEDEDQYALTLSDLDHEYFKDRIQSDPPECQVKASLRSHRLIQKAANYFHKILDEKFSHLNATDKYTALRALKTTIVDRLKLVVIEVGSDEEAYQIFETLNDRGLRLSVPDLLLNFLMKNSKTKAQREKIRENWNEVITDAGTRRVSTFLRHMWVSMYGDVKSQSLYREIRAYVQDEQFSSLEFSKLCVSECKAYTNIIKVDSSLPSDSKKHIDALVNGLSADKTYPALLAGLTCLSESDFSKLSYLLVSLYVRYSVLADLNPSILEDYLYQSARLIREKFEKSQSSQKILSEVKKLLKHIDPSKQQISAGIENAYVNKKQAQYLLREIASQLQSPAKAIQVADESIEHIFPVNATDHDWPKSKDLKPLLWHIGNLTILEKSKNKDIGNKAYKIKKSVYAASAIKFTSNISSEFTRWDPAAVIKRSKSMVKHIEQIWRMQ